MARLATGAKKSQKRETKYAKRPIDPRTGQKIDATNRENYLDFEKPRAGAQKHDGIGLALCEDRPELMIDLDHCMEANGDVCQWAKDIVYRFNTYTEISPSGGGLKLLMRAKLPKPNRNSARKLPWPYGESARIEIYDQKRYTTITGHLFDERLRKIKEGQKELDRLYAELFPRNSAMAGAGPGPQAAGGRAETGYGSASNGISKVSPGS